MNVAVGVTVYGALLVTGWVLWNALAAVLVDLWRWRRDRDQAR